MNVVADAPRLDVWLAAQRGITRQAARVLIDAGLVRVGGRPAKPGQRIRDQDGDAVVVLPQPGRAVEVVHDEPAPELRIVYDDAWLAVIDKPAGLVVHPGAGHRSGTLADGLRALGASWSRLGGEERPGIVHRLDRDTSGLLVVARTEAAHRALAEQLRDRSMGRTYWTLVQGGLHEASGTIDAPIGRDPGNRRRMAVIDGGRAAVTDFRVVERLGAVSRLEVQLRTGRTHQIRVHLAYIRHPVVGDAVYGRPDPQLPRPALHAAQLHFRHPADGEVRTFESPLPPDLAAALARARSTA